MNACIHAYMKTGETEGMERSGERICFLNGGRGTGRDAVCLESVSARVGVPVRALLYVCVCECVWKCVNAFGRS